MPAPAARRAPILQAGTHSLVGHWVSAYERFLAATRHLEHVRLMRYEDVVADPDAQFATVFRFMGLTPHELSLEMRTGLNERYIRLWERSARSRRGRAHRAHIEQAFEQQVRPFGYSLVEPYRLLPPERSLQRLFLPS